MKILLKSPYACLVKTNSAECELDVNDTLEIEDEQTLLIYPQNSYKIPFYINMNALHDCENYSVFSRDNKKIVLLEKSANFHVLTSEKLNFSGKTVEICVGENTLSFESSGKKVTCVCEHKCNTFSTFKIKNFACVQFEEDLYVFSIKESKAYHFKGEIEIDGNQVSVTKKFHDSAAREKKSIFRLEEEIELESEEFVSNASVASMDNSRFRIRELAPYKLLECIKAKDFSCAMNFLSENLKDHIDLSQIKEFFGNFTTFLPLSTTEFITINGQSKNYVQFSMHENLIDDISVDEL